MLSRNSKTIKATFLKRRRSHDNEIFKVISLWLLENFGVHY